MINVKLVLIAKVRCHGDEFLLVLSAEIILKMINNNLLDAGG